MKISDYVGWFLHHRRLSDYAWFLTGTCRYKSGVDGDLPCGVGDVDIVLRVPVACSAVKQVLVASGMTEPAVEPGGMSTEAYTGTPGFCLYDDYNGHRVNVIGIADRDRYRAWELATDLMSKLYKESIRLQNDKQHRIEVFHDILAVFDCGVSYGSEPESGGVL